MKKARLGGAKRREDLQDRLKNAETELAPLMLEVRRNRDRLEAESLTLRFVWHQAGHPHPGKLWELVYGRGCWSDAGHFFGSMELPTNLEPTPYDCRIYLVGGDSNVCKCFTQHCREAEAIFGRMAGDGTRFNWANMLFDTFRDAVDEEDRTAVEWRENEEPDRPETWSYIAEFKDVFEWTRLLLKTFVDGAVLRQRSPDGRLPDDDGNQAAARKLQRPDGEQGDKAGGRAKQQKRRSRKTVRAAMLVEQAVRNYHKFDGGIVDQEIPPISGRELVKISGNAFSASSADRWFKARFGSKKAYESACLSGKLGKLLTVKVDDLRRAFGTFDQSDNEVSDDHGDDHDDDQTVNTRRGIRKPGVKQRF